MKQILIALACSGLLTAQNFVFIPDTAFLSFLKTLTPAAVSGQSLDISHTLVTQSTKTINLLSTNISNLNGIEHFTALDKLEIYYGSKTVTVSALPLSLKILNINYTNILLPTLPATLTRLTLSNCSVTVLPLLNISLQELLIPNNKINLTTLPPNLNVLDCSFNDLTNLPQLPATLITLKCNANLLGALPAFPPNLINLNCSQNSSITILPALPGSIQTLDYSGCPVGNITSLPASLRSLICSNTNATQLFIQSQVLESLDCSKNQLKNLPALPPNVKYLYCHNNQLNELPFLPSRLRHLNCENNLLTGLPDLPDTLNVFYCGGNYISCFREIPLSINPPGSFKHGPYYIGLLPNPFTCLPNFIKYHEILPPDHQNIPFCTPQENEHCNLTTSVEESVYLTIGIYPNPASDLLKINTNGEPIQSITIVDATGRIIFQCDSCENTITTSQYQAGIYLLKATISNKEYTARFVIAH